jgi:uncharacterized repeat protein (TIGR02543 family)
MHYGTTSKNYQHTVDVHNNMTCSISGLAEGTTYYFALTAYNDKYINSNYSGELAHTIPTTPPPPGDTVYSETFNAYTAGSDPVDWLDTASNNSMAENDSLFEVFAIGGENVYGTDSTQANIHSHYMGGGSGSLTEYEYTGRMMITNAKGGIGVTFYSQYPGTDAYYRLRRYDSNAFHLSPHGTKVTGDTNTGVVPQPNVWYRFKIQVENTGSQTEIRAKVWQQGKGEPTDWQANAIDASSSRLTAGTFGLWSYYTGSKYWDDLTVTPLGTSPLKYALIVDTVGDGGVESDPPGGTYNDGTVVQLTATAAAGWEFDGWSGDRTGSTNSVTISMGTDINVKATFTEIVEAPPLQYELNVDTFRNGSVKLNPSGGTYDDGTVVQLTASAAAGWEFTGWSGDLSGSANPATIIMTGDQNITATFVDSDTQDYAEGFEAYSDGDDPVDWLDTAANNSMAENDNLFEIFDLGGEKVYGTDSTQANIHSHHVGGGSDSQTDYEYSGRMMITNAKGGIGVTFYSQYPNEDVYYRLRRYNSNAFHIAPHGTKVTGDSDTGVVPLPNIWYRFKIQVEDTGSQTEIRAKVWQQGKGEPAAWQADCYDKSASRLTVGTFGIWSYYSGKKYWDDLTVTPLGTPAMQQYTLTVDIDGNGNAALNPPGGTYNEGTDVQLTATAEPGWEIIGWSGDITGSAKPVTITMDADISVTAIFNELADNYSETFNAYEAGSDPADWLDTAANNSMAENDSLFEVFDLGDEKVYGTDSTQANIHSHYVGGGSGSLSEYEYTGRMMITNAKGGIGVTFFSQYPNEDAYYRLRRYNSNAFHIAPHGTKVTGDSNTGVVPLPNIWYRFKIQVEDTGSQTEIRAKVWQQGKGEPAAWQADCYDKSSSRLTAGTFGIWSYYSGKKYWDDMVVVSLLP